MFNVNRNGQKKGDTTVTFSNKNVKNAALRRSVHTPVSTTSSPDILVFKRHVIELCLNGLCAISRIATISANHRQRQPRLSPVHAVWWSKSELCWLRLTSGLRGMKKYHLPLMYAWILGIYYVRWVNMATYGSNPSSA